MELGYLLVFALLLAWIAWGARESMWKNAGAEVDAASRAAAVARLAEKGRAMFARAAPVTFEQFVAALGGDCSAAGVSTPAAYYGFRAMVDAGGAGATGITPERVALLADPLS